MLTNSSFGLNNNIMNNPNGQESRILSLKDAANRIGMSKTFLWKEATEGKIRHLRLGNRIKIFSDDLDAYREARVIEAKP